MFQKLVLHQITNVSETVMSLLHNITPSSICSHECLNVEPLNSVVRHHDIRTGWTELVTWSCQICSSWNCHSWDFASKNESRIKSKVYVKPLPLKMDSSGPLQQQVEKSESRFVVNIRDIMLLCDWKVESGKCWIFLKLQAELHTKTHSQATSWPYYCMACYLKVNVHFNLNILPNQHIHWGLTTLSNVL